MAEPQQPLMLCMENAMGEEVTLRIEPEDDFHTFIEKAKSILGSDIDINSITGDQAVSLTDNIYQFLSNTEQNTHNQAYYESLEHGSTNDLMYILDDGTQINASQIHFYNDEPSLDLTNEKLPFVKYVKDSAEEFDVENYEFEKIVNYSIARSPILRRAPSPKSYISNLPFKLVCNNTSGFEAQFTKYLETAANKTYTTLSNVNNRNKSPRSLIRDNYAKYDDSYQHRIDNCNYTREEVLNMFKNSPVNSLPYVEGFSERRHVRKTDPSRVQRSYRPASYEIDGVLINDNGKHICFICAKKVDRDKLYLFDNEDQKIHRCSPQKKQDTQLKIICENCLKENFMPCRMKGANQFLGSDEYLVIRNNQQFIFKKTKNIDLKKNFVASSAKINADVNTIVDEFVKVEIGSDGEIITKPVDDKSDDVIIIQNEQRESGSSDVEIIEPETEVDNLIENLEEADEEVREFLEKYHCDDNVGTKELTCRFCNKIFIDISAVIDHGEVHKYDLDDGHLYPCPICNYGYAHFKWLKGHLKAAHDKKEDVNKIKEDATTNTQTDTKRNSASKILEDGSTEKTVEETKEKEEKPEEEIKVEVHTEVVQVKTEAGNEELKSSDDEIWIVQTADHQPSTRLQKLLDAAKVLEERESVAKKPPKCLNCSQGFPSVEALASHRCRRRGRKRKQVATSDTVIKMPTKEDFMKRAQGRPRFIDTSADNHLLVERTKKNKIKEPTSDPKIVTCDNCNESFTSKVRLKFHMQFHETTSMLTSDGQYTCLNCPEAKFPTETALFDHVHFQHDKQKRWQCPVHGCGKAFHLRATLTKHSRTHTDTRRYVCVACGKRFLDKQTLDEHGVTHLQIKPFECHICRKQLTRRSRLRMHLRAHEEEVSPTLLLVCRRCGRAFRDSQHAQEHAATSTECIQGFVSEMKEENEEEKVQLSPTSGIVRQSTQIIVLTESPKPSETIPRQVASPLARPLLAQVPDEAKTIIRVVEVDKAFRCEYCEDVFYLEDSLNTHRAIHKGVKNPFTCHICKVSFATYSRCTTHKTTHGFYKRSLAEAKKQAPGQVEAGPAATGILGYGDFPVVKHFLCEDCGRSYLHWTYLQVHRRMKHVKANFTYPCNQCEMTFPNSWSLAYHRKKIHGKIGQMSTSNKQNYRIPCRDCDAILPNKTALYKHRKMTHSDVPIKINRQDVSYAAACEDHRLVGYSSSCSDWLRMSQNVNESSSSTGLRDQKLMHSGVRAWACARCPKRFRIRSELSAHLRLKHPVSIIVIEVEGLNPSSEDITNILTANNLSRDKIGRLTKISFPKGTSSIVPNSARALSMLSNVPRTQVAWGMSARENIGDVLRVNDYQQDQSGKALNQGPMELQLTMHPSSSGMTPHNDQRAEQQPITEIKAPELSDLNVQLLLRDGVLVDGNQMVQLQFEDTLLLE